MFQARLTEDSFDSVVNHLASIDLDGEHEVIIQKVSKRRTDRQNRALHVYLEMLSTKLNDAGFDQVALLALFKHGFTMPWTKTSLKGLFQRIAGTLTGEDRTHKLSTIEMQDVYNVFDRGISEKTGIHVPFPSLEPPLIGGRDDNHVSERRDRASTSGPDGRSRRHADDLNNDMPPPARREESVRGNAVPGSDNSDRGGEG